MSGKTLKRALIGHLPIHPWTDHLVSFLSFVRQHHRLPDKKSQLFNDVIYRIKTSAEARDPLRLFVTDKEFAKTYVKDTVGAEHCVPTLAVLRHPDDVSPDVFPDRCVIKPTHASGHIITRTHGEPLDYDRIRQWFALDYYRTSREPNYRGLHRKVIVEPILYEDEDIVDYKVFCFNGRPRLVQVDFGRHTRHCRKFYDLEWREQSFGLVYERGDSVLARPANLEKMLEVAATLARDFSLVRVDMYSDGESVFIGELTNCPSGALGVFHPADAELTASAMIFGDPASPAQAMPTAQPETMDTGLNTALGASLDSGNHSQAA